MSKENDDLDLTAMFRGISKQNQRIIETPLAQGVEELIGEVNREALEGKGVFRAEVGEVPTETTFSLSWEGIQTKQEVYKPKSSAGFEFTTYPFNLSIKPFPTEDSFYGFRVTAKYLPGDFEPVEVGRTGRLDVGELKPIIRGQIPSIKQAAQR